MDSLHLEELYLGIIAKVATHTPGIQGLFLFVLLRRCDHYAS